MKRRTIITSVLVIVLCLGLISGSTFALFTSESKVNIAVTSGKVNIDAKLGSLKLYSADATLTEGDKVDKINPLDKTGTILPTDPQGAFAGTYYYKDQTTFGEFLNGGTAEIETNTETSTQSLSIQKITPGDKVTVNINITNKSNVAIQYRVKVNVLSGLKLYEALVVKVDGVSLKGVQKVSNWTYLDVPATEEAKILTPIPVEVYLPLDVSDATLQNLATSMQITVEAVQGNAKTTNETLAQAINVEKPVADTAATQGQVITDNDQLVEVSVPAAAFVDEIPDTTTSLSVKIEPKDTVSDLVLTSTQTSQSYDLEVLIKTQVGTADPTTEKYNKNNKPDATALKIKMFVGTGLTGVKLYHKASVLTAVASLAEVDVLNEYYYDSTDGYITLMTNSFSEYTVVYNKDIAVEKNNTITVYTPTEDAGVYETKEGTQVVYNEATKEFSDFGDSVARIGVTGYPTLQAAVDVANAATESLTITILKNFTQETAVGINKNVTIDLAGKTITNNVIDNRMIRLGDASLTILGNNGQVIIPESNIGSYGFVDMRDSNGVAYSNAVLTIKDTYFEGATSGGSFFQFRADEQTMTLENVEANCTKGNGQIYDGYANGLNASIVNGYGTQVKLTILGGEYTYDSREGEYGVFQAGNYNTNNIVNDESDVTLKNVKVVAQCGPILEGHGSVSIDNCNFSVNPEQTGNAWYSSAVSVALKGVSIVVNDGNYSARYGAYVFSSGGEIDINGGSFKGTGAVLCAQTGDNYNNDALINVTGGTFDGKLSVSSVGSATAKIKISGGTFVNTSFEVTGNNASIEISGGTFDHDPTDYVDKLHCAVIDNGNGTWTVQKIKTYVYSIVPNEDNTKATVIYKSDENANFIATEEVRYLTATNLGSQTTDTTFDIYCGNEKLATGVTFTNVFNGSSTNPAGVNTHILIGRNVIKFPAGDIYFTGDSYVNSEALFMIGSTDGEGNPTTRLLANGTNSVGKKGLQLENREAKPSTRIHYFENIVFDGSAQSETSWGHLITMTSYAIDAEFKNVVFQNMTQPGKTAVVGIWAGESLHDATQSYPTKDDNVGVDVRFTNVNVNNINNKPIFLFQGFTQLVINANENCYSYISVVFDAVSAENCGLNNSSAYATQNGNNNYKYNGTHYYWTVNGVEVSNVEGTTVTLGTVTQDN